MFGISKTLEVGGWRSGQGQVEGEDSTSGEQ